MNVPPHYIDYSCVLQEINVKEDVQLCFKKALTSERFNIMM